MMCDVVTAKREDVLVILPVALYEFDLEAFFLEETLFNGGKDRGFTRDANVANAYLI
jgi:hypothetical protein